MHPKMKHVYVGIDIHRETHTAVIINCFGDKLGEITFLNKPSDFSKLLKEVKKHTPEGITPAFGLENVVDSGRALAVFLTGKNHIVKYVNANLTYSERKNQPMLHKTDSHDGLCVARVLLNRLGELPDVDLNDSFWAMSQLTKRRAALVKANVGLKNQLQSHIIHHYPSYKKYFHLFDCKTALAFWEKYPSPQALKDVTPEDLGAFLFKHSHRYYSIDKAKEILAFIDKDGDTQNSHQENRDFIVKSIVKQIKYTKELIQEIEKEITVILPSFGYKLESMKGINTVMAAEFISEIGDIQRFSSPDKLAKYSGIAPVSYSSGQTDRLLSNRLGDRRLHQLFFLLAVTVTSGRQKLNNEIFYNYYKKKLSEGKTTKQALKSVMRRLVNIIYHMMKDKTAYRQP